MRQWAQAVTQNRPEVIRIGYFGSYARGDWGVGSDVDIVVVVKRTDLPFERRAVEWDASRLPVPADVLVYTAGEWDRLAAEGFQGAVKRQTIWVYG